MSFRILIPFLGLFLLGVTFSTSVIYHFEYSDFTNVTTVNLINGDVENGALRLTKETGGSRFGAAWYINKVHLDSFNTTFTLYMQNNLPTGVRDGIAFVIQNANDNINSLVNSLGGLGYGSTGTGPEGITNSLAVEFDTYHDQNLGDPLVDHISVHSKGTAGNSANESAALVPAATGIPPLRNTTVSFRIIYSNKTLSVFLIPNGGPSIKVEDYDLVGSLGLKENGGDGTAYIGFTSSCGDGMCANQEVLSWEFNYLGITTAAESTAEGAGLVAGIAGDTGTFTIQAVDQFGYNVTIGGADFEVNLVSFDASNNNFAPQNTQVNVTDNKDGTYSVHYNVTVSGSYSVSVTLGGQNIKGSPFTVPIIANNVTASTSQASGDGLVGPVTAGDEKTIEIYAKDAYGNNVTQSTDAVFQIVITNSSGTVLSKQATSQGNGVYSVAYNLTVSGNYNISITYQSQEIQGSPYPTITVLPAAPDPTLCTASGNGIQGGYVGVQQNFSIVPRDRFGNLITAGIPANDAFGVTLSSADGTVKGQVVQNSSPLGITYLGVYNITASGIYTMNVTLNTANIAQSPFTVSILPSTAAWGPKCIAYGAGSSSGIAGVTETFVIQARDIFGNNMTENNQVFKVSFFRTDGQQPQITSSVKQSTLGEGKYDVFYTTTEAFAGYRINITLFDLLIANGTLPCQVLPSSVYAPHCTAQGSSLTSAKKDKTQTFILTTRDRYNNLLITGGANVTVILKDYSEGTTVVGYVEDLKNGTYTVSYKLTKDGHYSMGVFVDGGNIADSPFFIEIDESGIDKMIFVWIGLGVGGFLLLVVLVAGFFLYRRFRKRHDYQAFGL